MDIDMDIVSSIHHQYEHLTMKEQTNEIMHLVS